MIRVLINGYKGKMGSESVLAVEKESDLELVDRTDQGDDLKARIESSKVDVVVDFTEPSCAMNNTKIIAESNAGGVIGTTGFQQSELDELRNVCANKSPGLLIAPNFSISAILLMKLSVIASQHMPDVEIIELHHPKKKDAPSGTAVKTAELISESQGKATVPRGTSDDRALGELHFGIPVHSVRLPGFLAHQEVIFGGEGQSLSIRQDSYNRTCFMPGVVLGIRKVMENPGLTYGLEHFLFND